MEAIEQNLTRHEQGTISFGRPQQYVVMITAFIFAAAAAVFPGRALISVGIMLIGYALWRASRVDGAKNQQLARTGHLATAVAVTMSLVLTWTGIRYWLPAWRVIWVALILALSVTQILASRRRHDSEQSMAVQLVNGCPMIWGSLLALPALLPSFPSLPSPWYLWIIAATTLVTAVDSWLHYYHRIKRWSSRYPHLLRSSVSWLLYPTLFLLGVHFGGGSRNLNIDLNVQRTGLLAQSHDELNSQLETDLDHLRGLDRRMEDILDRMSLLRARIEASTNPAEAVRAEENHIRELFFDFVAARASLLKIVVTYAPFEDLARRDDSDRCFLVGYAAAVRTFDVSARVVSMYQDLEPLRLKMNEAQYQRGLEPGMFEWVSDGLINTDNTRLLLRMRDHFVSNQSRWEMTRLWPRRDWEWLQGRILQSWKDLDGSDLNAGRATTERMIRRADILTQPIVTARWAIYEWIGDTGFEQPRNVTSPQRARLISDQLQPGDIVLQRREWSLSNLFLPGFWSHAAIYLGGVEGLVELNILDHPSVVDHVSKILEQGAEAGERTIIEAISEGVVFSTPRDSLKADYVAVLRPTLSREEIAQAMIRAMDMHGLPYDYDFNFSSGDKIVCTELIYRAFYDLLDLTLVDGVKPAILPADELVKKYAAERAHPDGEFEFVLFAGNDSPEIATGQEGERAFLETLQ
ncbi:MAG: YiiX/YebB-like N1pC/P60 family cysteine hydrolase [Planctomycetota bacterium]|jgi:hypothetical protein